MTPPACLSFVLTAVPHSTRAGSTLRIGSWSIRLEADRAHVAVSDGDTPPLKLSRFAQTTL
jgi:hypothetical protein